MKILITGGAGFVGSHLCKLLRETYPEARIVALDNLKRRGSELNLPRLKSWNIEFKHGDIRVLSDLTDLQENFDLMVEASAEPSVLSGLQGDSPRYALESNLVGTLNCLEFARKHCPSMVFLSTSRVYSATELRNLPLAEGKSRFEVSIQKPIQGLSKKGISEDFPTSGYRSIYGTTKLSSEMLIEEYVHAYGLKAVINRCSILCGPWQMGKIDQGVFSLWLVRHFFGGNLNYTGFGGKGFQVRDLLHPQDLFSLLKKQIEKINSSKDKAKAEIFNIGGGMANSISLFELTSLCQDITGRKINIGSVKESPSVDVPFYITDSSKAEREFQWKPEHSISQIMHEIFEWLKANKAKLEEVFEQQGEQLP